MIQVLSNIFEVGLSQKSEIATGSQKYRDVYSRDISAFDLYKDEPFYEHILHINKIYLELQREENNSQKQTNYPEEQVYGLKSS